MKLSGTITDLPDREDYLAAGEHMADVGVKKPGKGRGAKRAARPTFFRVVTTDELADEIIEDYEPGQVVTFDIEDASVRIADEQDEIGRRSVVIRCNGTAIARGAPRR